jgi:hydrogenase maturation factor
MSNLTLPKMNPANLAKIAKVGIDKKIAYATIVNRMVSGDYMVYHHGNAIACIGTGEIEVSNAGWDSSTTRTRLNIILRDNDISARVYQKNYNQYLSFNGKDYEFSSAVFQKISGEWLLTIV